LALFSRFCLEEAKLRVGSAKMNIPVPQINALFAPRQPVEFIPPIDIQRKKKKRKNEMDGIGAFVPHLETGAEYDDVMKKWKEIEQRPERRERIKVERKTMCDETLAEKAAAWDPSSYVMETDAYKTLFIGRLSFMTDEHKIKREMEQVNSCTCVSVHVFSQPALLHSVRASC